MTETAGNFHFPKHQEVMTGIQRLLKVDVHDHWDGFAHAKQLAEQRKPIVWLFSHNMINDGLALISILRGDATFAKRDLILPMSAELYDKRGYRFGQNLLRTKFIPVVTPEVRERQKTTKGAKGLLTYLRESGKVIGHGGMVAIAPQARGNQGELDTEAPTGAFSLFMNMMRKRPMGREFYVVPVGISAPDARSQKGMHIGKRLRVDFGKCLRSDEVEAEAKEFDNDADTWALRSLATLLPFSAVKREP
jgi:hypothetical protein